MHPLIEKTEPLIAAITYGSWSAYSNSEHGVHASINAGLTQGMVSFISTWLLRTIVFALFNRLNEPSATKVFAICSAGMIALPVSTHLMSNTPNIVQAIAPSMIIGHCYLLYLVVQGSKRLVTTVQVLR